MEPIEPDHEIMTEEEKNYLLEKGRSWMLPEEQRALTRCDLTLWQKIVERKKVKRYPEYDKFYGFLDNNTNALVALGEEALKLKIAERLFKNYKDQILNTCPRCEKLARTPLAKQCRHCGLDWH